MPCARTAAQACKPAQSSPRRRQRACVTTNSAGAADMALSKPTCKLAHAPRGHFRNRPRHGVQAITPVARRDCVKITLQTIGASLPARRFAGAHDMCFGELPCTLPTIAHTALRCANFGGHLFGRQVFITSLIIVHFRCCNRQVKAGTTGTAMREMEMRKHHKFLRVGESKSKCSPRKGQVLPVQRANASQAVVNFTVIREVLVRATVRLA